MEKAEQDSDQATAYHGAIRGRTGQHKGFSVLRPRRL